MVKGALTAIAVVSLVLVIGCSAISGQENTPSPGKIKILREAQLGPDWNMKQMNVEVDEGGEVSVLLRLADGNKVDGYFYLQRDGVEFSITADSLIYESKGTESKEVVSDRFTFTASRAQGSSYALNFANNDNKQGKVTVFLEVIYPVSGSVFIPIETK